MRQLIIELLGLLGLQEEQAKTARRSLVQNKNWPLGEISINTVAVLHILPVASLFMYVSVIPPLDPQLLPNIQLR